MITQTSGKEGEYLKDIKKYGPTKKQSEFILNIKTMNGIAFVADSIEVAQNELKGYLK